MKKLIVFLILTFSWSFGQSNNFPLKHEDFSAFLMNYGTPFHGEISADKTVIKV